MAAWRVAFCSNLEAGLADIPAEMSALHAFFARNGLRGGWRKVGEVLGVSGAYARELAYNVKPLNQELIQRWLLETGRYRAMYEVQPCPDCGSVHTGRCHGRPAAQVVVLAPDERVLRTTSNAGADGAAIECTAEIARCACGQLYVKRSWNHVRCAGCRAGRHSKKCQANAKEPTR